jgi:hypothetical protein
MNLTSIAWVPVVWKITKTYLLHQLKLPYEEDPHVLLNSLLEQAPALLEARPGNPGVFCAMVFMMLVYSHL